MPVSETSSHIYNILNKIEKKYTLRLLSRGEVSILAMDEKTCLATKYQTLIRREYQQVAQDTCSLAFLPPTNQFQSLRPETKHGRSLRSFYLLKKQGRLMSRSWQVQSHLDVYRDPLSRICLNTIIKPRRFLLVSFQTGR